MRRILIMLFAALLLAGCGRNPQPETVAAFQEEETTEPSVTESEPPMEPPDSVLEVLKAMTLEEKVGQLFLARCPTVDDVTDVKEYHLGGYILFGRDFSGQTPETIRFTLGLYQEAAKIPLLIAVDEEGGTVCRVSREPAFREEPFYSPGDIYDYGGMDAVLAVEAEKAELLHSLGICVNMAPVVDIARNQGAFMYSRSLRQSPEITAQYGVLASEKMAEYGIGSVLKHFPGYGSNADTHSEMVVDQRSLEELEAADLIPFAEGAKHGCGAILMSHNIVTALDDTYPVSLSGPAHAYLRNVIGFPGVVITDELSMGAITKAYGAEEAAVLAVEAGNDLLCVTDYKNQYPAVLQAVEDGRIPEETIDQAVYRVLTWKQQLGIL